MNALSEGGFPMAATGADSLEQNFARLAESRLGKPYSGLQFDLDYFLGSVDPRGKRCVDVGAGSGMLSAYLVVRGAKSVVALEPELAGANSGFTSDLETMVDELGLRDRVTVLAEDFVTADLGPEPFDLIVSQNSINHLREVDEDIRRSRVAREAVRPGIRRMADILRPGGVLLVGDCSRENVYQHLGRFGWPGYFGAYIEWEKHQYPKAWQGVLAEEGFRDFRIRWWTPRRTRAVPWLFGNSVMNYFTASYWYLTATRGDAPAPTQV